MPTRLEEQIRFIIEIDKLKSIIRRTMLIDRSRDENSAEHSWHIALMTPLLAEYADGDIDVYKVMKMLLVHDVVEIDAGDTYCYDTAAHIDKAEREKAAANRLFCLLPSDQAAEFRALWDEFEAGDTPDAKFAHAMDRLQPLLLNYQTEGETWRAHGITIDQVRQRMAPIALASQTLADFVRNLLADAHKQGYMAKKSGGTQMDADEHR